MFWKFNFVSIENNYIRNDKKFQDNINFEIQKKKKN